MGRLKRYKRHSAKVTRSRRWKAVRLLVLRRDEFRCVECGARDRLEVDHIEPVRDRPDLAFEIDNLQALCASCHSRKTRLEVGHAPLSEARQQWRDLLSDKCPTPETSKPKKEIENA